MESNPATSATVSLSQLLEYIPTGAEERATVATHVPRERIKRKSEKSDRRENRSERQMKKTVDTLRNDEKKALNDIAVVEIKSRLREITLVSCYFETDLPMDPYLAHLKRVQRETGTQSLIIAGVNKYSKAIGKACLKTIPLIKHNEELAMPWWSEELAALKRETATKINRIRYETPVRREKVVREYLEVKTRYETEVRGGKQAHTRS
ncbi:unnamed protein product [Euphydryas editha]|uniref:Uncharacterized protein n=1 Tax=Euphydryas editha TaxID=104508 RepID=A0AAU9UJZ0_EUPED|nr:unnamed protein product [Euphydryas editha]